MNNLQRWNEDRRGFIKRAVAFVVVPSLIAPNNACHAQTQRRSPSIIIGGGCDGCEGIYEGMPQGLSWQTQLASASEPGERLEMSGAVYQADGKTPAPGVILYVYHTDARGYYSPTPNATGLTRRHGHLRGWMRTTGNGEYKFTTIKPAPYPERNNPAHIHPIVKEPDKNEYYIDEYVFDDDPLLTSEKRLALEGRGGSGIIRLVRDSDGSLTGKRNIILGLSIPHYK